MITLSFSLRFMGRSLLRCSLLFIAVGLLSCSSQELGRETKPNVIIIFTDDQGYGDLASYGSDTIRSPRLDQLAQEGTRFTNFYAQAVCGPSRSALLTGRYPIVSGGWSMPASEITLGELFQTAGYQTGHIGKWDVSNRVRILERMPNAQGFDYSFGHLGGNDKAHVHFVKNQQRFGSTNDMSSLTRLFTDESIQFIEKNRERPFFLYLAHTMPHSIVDASPEFSGKSKAGLYGDVIEELDHHTGRLLDAIDELGLRDNTIVIFMSDNGPWNNNQQELREKNSGRIAWGSSGPLRGGKGSTYEGGFRVPCILRWPDHVPAGRVSAATFATIDLLPTLATLAGYAIPTDRKIHGVDQTDLLLGKSEAGARDDFFYFSKNELHGVRKGPWKLMLPDRRDFYRYVSDRGSGGVELYSLENDVGEEHNVAKDHPEVVQRLLEHAKTFEMPDRLFSSEILLGR
jgi:arylsulfatase A-like enzyme